MRRQSRQPMTGRQALAIVACISMLAAGAGWWEIYGELTDNLAVRCAYTAIRTLAPPALTAFLIPWSPAGMLLQKINARTWGQTAVAFCACYLIYDTVDIYYSWWSVQPVTAETGLVWHQVGVSVLGSIFIPALLFAPVPSEAAAEQIKQAHLVAKYEIQAEADIQLLRTSLTRGRNLARRGLSNLSKRERVELGMMYRTLVQGIDQTLDEIYSSVDYVAAGADVRPKTRLLDNPHILDALETIEDVVITDAPVPTRQPVDVHSSVMDEAFQRQAQRHPASARTVQTRRR